MKRYILKRVLQSIPLLLLTSFLVFSLIKLAPYDAIDAITTPDMTAERIEFLKHKHGLDQPFLVQFFVWLRNILTGDFGNSIITHQPIAKELSVRIPNTIKLILPAYITALILGVMIGLYAAQHRGKRIDSLIDGLLSLGISVPTFWLAMIFIYFFGLQLKWVPTIGMHTIGKEGDIIDFLKHFILPYSILVLVLTPGTARYVRAMAINQLKEDYILVQESLGSKRREIFSKHVSRNVLLPIITSIGMDLPMLVTGAIISERIFAWPGVGPYLMDATRKLDYPVIMALMLLSAILVIVGNLLADISYSMIDPRIRRSGE